MEQSKKALAVMLAAVMLGIMICVGSFLTGGTAAGRRPVSAEAAQLAMEAQENAVFSDDVRS